MVTTNADSYANDIAKGSFQRAIAHPGDLIVSTLFDRRKLLVYAADDPLAVVNSSCAIIRSAHAGDYIVSYLRTVQGQEDFLAKASKATGGTFIPRLSIADLAAIKIPILPVSELARLGDAKIERSTKPELISLKRELQSKDAEIGQLKAKNAALARFYEDRIRAIESQIATNDLLSRIKHGETARLEFKSSLRWNVHRKAHGPEIENAVLKTIAAFCNTKGGELLIGVAPDNTVVGVEHDGISDNDKFLLHLRNLLTERLKPCLVEFGEYGMVNLDGRWICHVQCGNRSGDAGGLTLFQADFHPWGRDDSALPKSDFSLRPIAAPPLPHSVVGTKLLTVVSSHWRVLPLTSRPIGPAVERPCLTGPPPRKMYFEVISRARTTYTPTSSSCRRTFRRTWRPRLSATWFGMKPPLC
ncbi:MAG: RNA-binding domain-containing protein [Candidatus Binatia bacterium]